jgi:integrase
LIERQRLPLAGGERTCPPKYGQVRRVALGPAGLELLSRYRRATEERARALGIVPAEDGWLLSYDCGHTPWPPRTLGARVARLGRAIGEPVTTHVLRHFAATQLVGAGVDVVTTARRLGHSPEVMLRVYASFLPERDAEAARQLEASVLGGP